jgi:pimeloyl-ACP methyl ester carboxylesterase
MQGMNLLVGGAALYGLAVGGLFLLQDDILFPRAAAAFPSYPLPPGTERLELRTADGVTLVGNLIRAREPARALLLGFAGNAWNGDDFTVFLAQRLPDFDIVSFHYRGYAPSEGRPSEAALCQDAQLVHDRVLAELRPERLFVAGFSLGSGVAACLAAARPLDGLLLVTPFDSIEAVARQRYFWAPIRTLLKHRFRSDRHLAGRDVPTAVIMASHDRIVPRARSEALVRVLRRPVMVESVPDSGHTTIYDQERFDELLRAALDALLAARPGPQPSAATRPAPSAAPRLATSEAG